MLNNASILITGGTGSFGNYFVDYLLKHYHPKRIVIYSRDEFKQFHMHNRFIKYDSVLRFFIGDVRDGQRLQRAFEDVDYVVHAAAMKQVPACEYNPLEAIKTNIMGATNVIEAALDARVKKVIALSTDKAVNPINLYGGTKLVSDKLFTSANAYSGTGKCWFSVVRYGNVAGSRGSVIPFFAEQLRHGATELPVTDERMTRFWTTLDQSVELVIKSISHARGGETFVYKNPSFYVTDLVKAMNPGGSYKVVGIREGEKLHECMVTSDDASNTYEYDDHYIIYPNYSWWNGEILPNGKKVDLDWSYLSNTNTRWLDAQELRERISRLALTE